MTPADFVKGRYGSRGLSLAVAVTGILATMPYIALQLVGIQAVLEVMGVGGAGNTVAKDLPLLIAFAVLAAYTYSCGPARAGADRLRQGRADLPGDPGRDHLPAVEGRRLGPYLRRRRRQVRQTNPATGKPTGRVIPATAQLLGRTRRWRSVRRMALFMYPHSITAVLSSRSRNVIRRNASILPAYSLLLGLLALLGFMAIAAGTKPIGLDGKPNAQLVVPQLFEDMFPSWFAGVAFAAIAHRRTGPGGDHVHRGGEPVHPQHLP